MKKSLLVTWMFCVAAIFSGCATTQEFKSLKEAECYVGTVQVSERFTKYGIDAYALKKPMNWKKGSSGEMATRIGVAVVTKDVFFAIPTPASPWSDYKRLTGGVSFSKMPLIVYREKLGEPIWNVSAEALKRAGLPPESDSCIYNGIRVEPKILGKNEYAGEDGKIVMSDGLSIHLFFERKPKAEPQCDEKAWQVYVDYVKSVADHAKKIMEEEFALPRRTQFCILESKDKP